MIPVNYFIYGRSYGQTSGDVIYTGEFFSFNGFTLGNIYFKTDGTKMYIRVHQVGVHQYDLTTPWDVSTAIYEKAQGVGAYSFIYISPNGDRLYAKTLDKLMQYNLSTPWDLDTMTFSKELTPAIASQDTSIFFSHDGTKMYLGSSNVNIIQYDLTIPWEIDTGVFGYMALNKKVPDQHYSITDTGDYYFNIEHNTISAYKLNTPNDLRTAVLETTADISAVTNSQGNFLGITLKPDGTKLFYSAYGSIQDIFSFYLATPFKLGQVSIT